MTSRVDKRQNWIRGRRQRRNLARSARVRRQITRYLLLFTLIAVGVSGFVYVPWSMTNVDSDITVRGNQVASVEQIRGALSNAVGKRLVFLNPQDMEARVQSLEAVRHAFVRRYLWPRPHLVVEVLEEFPWATFATDPESPPEYVISQTGRKIPIALFPGIYQPRFKIFGADDTEFSSKDVASWAEWVAFIEDQTGRSVDYVDLRMPHDIRVQNGELCWRVGTADSTLTRRLKRIASVMPVVERVRDDLEYVDLGLDNNVPLKIAKSLDDPKSEIAQSLDALTKPQVLEVESTESEEVLLESEGEPAELDKEDGEAGQLAPEAGADLSQPATGAAVEELNED